MNTIQIISASAGSGKTYRLTELLETGIVDRTVRPQAVLATTFTNKSAAELQERVRVRLLSAGHVEAAQQLSAARIGTVNSVCGRLVTDFAFDLGLSPELRVLDEEPAKLAVRRCIASVLTPDEEKELQDLSERMVGFDWQKTVGQIASLARANMISSDGLSIARDRSWKGCRELLGDPLETAADLDATLLREMKAFLKATTDVKDDTKKTKDAVNVVRQCVNRMERDIPLGWNQWLSLIKQQAAKGSDGFLTGVRVAASAQDRHPRLHSDMKRAIELVFDLSARALESYQREKRELGVIDFVDQETYALQLLGRKEVREHLGGELDLVLIDEFQDTSPIQLAIFLRLAEATRHSVWVGDQKQAVYGFRGADPMLMDAAIDEILEGKEPETLPKSFRSRPGLVDFTSSLFTPAFAQQGIPAARVNLKPALEKEPDGMGAFMECWPLNAKNVSQEAAALAATIKQLLEDKTARVRDRITDQVRPLRPSDVAVLCRTNDQTFAVATELAALGVRPVLPRQGLLSTLEGRAALAALRLWVDSRDALSAAELARLIDYAAREDDWLHAILDKPGDAAFADLPRIARIKLARDAAPDLGIVAIFDAVAEAIGLLELCFGWGDTEARIANVESLRSHVINYINGCTTEGAGCTAAGLVAYLIGLEQNGEDSQGVDEDDHAVVLSTWHGAKGLEWPVVVLYPLTRFDPANRALGVHVQSDRAKFSLSEPLAERWIRFWPLPYDPRNNATPFHDRLEEHPMTKAVASTSAREDLRLLYVGWTRARDRLILADRKGRITTNMLQLLRDDTQALVTEPDGNSLTWAGKTVDVVIREGDPLPPQPKIHKAGVSFAAAGPREYWPAFVQPSGVVGNAITLTDFERIGQRLGISGTPGWSDVGMAMHGFLCADRPGLSKSQRDILIKYLLSRWNVASVMDASEVVKAADAFRQWVQSKWPGAEWCREWPVLYENENGSVIRGSSDLVLRVANGLIVIDHKSFPGSIPQSLARAAEHIGQLLSYATAIEAAMEQPVLSVWVHLPVSGIVVPLAR